MDKYELLWVVVDFGKGCKIVKCAKANGVTGATIFLGRGTANNYFLKLLDLTDVRKEIVIMVIKKEIINLVIDAIYKKFRLDKPNHGIAFTMSLLDIYGINHGSETNDTLEKRGYENMYKAIFAVVDKGRAELVLDSAIAAGSKGATIINARGSGIHEQKMLFSFPIEPEKEIVMILSEEETTEVIVEAIRNELKIDEPGMGIMFTLNINNAYGLR